MWSSSHRLGRWPLQQLLEDLNEVYEGVVRFCLVTFAAAVSIGLVLVSSCLRCWWLTLILCCVHLELPVTQLDANISMKATPRIDGLWNKAFCVF